MIPTEEEEQVAVVEYMELRGHTYTHVPNSTFTKSWKVKTRNKRMGVRPGIPDLIAIIHNNLVFIEMKRVKGGILSPAQKEWIAALEDAGQTVWVCRGASDAIKQIQSIEKFYRKEEQHGGD